MTQAKQQSRQKFNSELKKEKAEKSSLLVIANLWVKKAVHSLGLHSSRRNQNKT